MTQILISKHTCFDHSKLEIGICLGFACLPVGREFAIWHFEIQRFYSTLCLFVFDAGRNGG
jgi:hypothetical protein